MKHNTQFFVEYFALDLLMNKDGMWFCDTLFVLWPHSNLIQILYSEQMLLIDFLNIAWTFFK